MPLQMVDHLQEVMRETVKVNLTRSGRPPEVVMRLGLVGDLVPQV